MSVGVPTGRIGAEYPLSYAVQSGLGSPAATPTTWINHIANTVNYVTGEHMIATAMGSRATEQESAQGETRTEGGFESNLRTSTSRGLLELFFGTVTPSGGNEIISVSRPAPLSLFDNLSGETHRYQDTMLDSLVLSCANHLEWHMAWTVLGGLDTLVDSTDPSGLDSADTTKAWADVTGFSGLTVVPCQISQFSCTFNNNVKLWYGAGQHAACAAEGGAFVITGSFEVRYDDANAASVHAAYVEGTDLGPTDVTIGPSLDQHVLSFPNITLVTCVPTKPLDDWMRLAVTFGVKAAQNFTYTLPAAA